MWNQYMPNLHVWNISTTPHTDRRLYSSIYTYCRIQNKKRRNICIEILQVRARDMICEALLTDYCHREKNGLTNEAILEYESVSWQSRLINGPLISL